MAIRFDRFTIKAQEAMQRAQQLAQEHNHQLLEPLHLLAALLTEEQGIVRALLNKVGANVDQLTKAVELQLRDIPEVTGGNGQIHISSATSERHQIKLGRSSRIVQGDRLG
jgi:ATP-dependent Clp protease ATP-binding subunit ClpB